MNNTKLIETYCLRDHLETYDPYDIWKTKLGFWIKNGFNRNKMLYMLPAATLTLFDMFLNNKTRFFYEKQEYPIARAFAALALLNLYEKEPKQIYLDFAKKHIDWLLQNKAVYNNGFGWGINFKWNIRSDIPFTEKTPLSTHTPYGLEAIYEYYKMFPSQDLLEAMQGIFEFYEHDILILYDEKQAKAISYGPYGNLIVNNATSYAMFVYSVFYNVFPDKQKEISDKIKQYYNFLCNTQRSDGSWLYAPFDKNSFIDCFHSAIIIKNLIKTKQNIDFELPDFETVVNKGYEYIKNAFFVEKHQLFKRFSKTNKPGIVKFDLYDNAEMLNLVTLMNDNDLVKILDKSIEKHFIGEKGVFSVIDMFGNRKNSDTLRWAVMPYLYALSKFRILI